MVVFSIISDGLLKFNQSVLTRNKLVRPQTHDQNRNNNRYGLIRHQPLVQFPYGASNRVNPNPTARASWCYFLRQKSPGTVDAFSEEPLRWGTQELWLRQKFQRPKQQWRGEPHHSPLRGVMSVLSHRHRLTTPVKVGIMPSPCPVDRSKCYYFIVKLRQFN